MDGRGLALELLMPLGGFVLTSSCQRYLEVEDMAMAMPASEVHEFARRLFAARGNGAIVEAAQKAVAFEKQNNSEEAEDWRRIEKALKLMQGPHSS